MWNEAGELTPSLASIYDYGFKPVDFDPMTNWPSQKSSTASFKPFPPDLSDEHIFNANPKHIAYDNILRLAARYSSSEILKKINEGRSSDVISRTAVDSRIKAALKSKADKEGTLGGKSLSKISAWTLPCGIAVLQKQPLA